MTDFYAYTHRRPDGAVFYVGAGTCQRAHNFNARHAAHKRVVAECGGKQNIVVLLTPCDTREQAFASEIALIAHYRAVGEPLVNQSSGGAAARAGVAHTAEARAKISAAHAGEKNPNFGKTHSVETRAKMSAAQSGKTYSVETRAKMSAAQSGEKNPNFGKTRSVETRAKISAAHKAYWAARRKGGAS